MNTQLSLTKKLTFSGIIAALAAVFTLLRIPMPFSGEGYLNLGDVAIFASAFILPDYVFCALACGVGSMIIDLIGYPLYAPATFIIKGLMAFFAVLAIRTCGKKLVFVMLPLAALCVPVGYFLYECILYGFGTAVISIPLNLAQGLVGAIAGGVLGYTLKARFIK